MTMRVSVTKFLNGKQIARAENTVETAEQLKVFLAKMGINKSDDDVDFDFNLYTERDYIIEEETPDYDAVLH